MPVYGLVIKIRNLLFDIGFLRSISFAFPVIGVGNLIAGGSGKTPLVEYIIRLIGHGNNTATLSRGYKRKTKGFRVAVSGDGVNEIGDEPLQYFTKFPQLTVSVCENRNRGIERLKVKFPDLSAIILDDVYQHRFVKPGLNILVTDYFNLYTNDHLLPYGMLREQISGAKRADIIVVTKTPKVFSPIVRKQILAELNPTLSQKVCFAFINYGNPIPLFTVNKEQNKLLSNLYSILMITGIGNPGPFEEYLKRNCTDLDKMEFPDHHEFLESDYEAIRNKFISLPTRRKMIVTTEKDAMRMQSSLSEKYLGDLSICYIPIEFEFHGSDKKVFDETVIGFVQKMGKPDVISVNL